jgi:hypothetical protein
MGQKEDLRPGGLCVIRIGMLGQFAFLPDRRLGRFAMTTMEKRRLSVGLQTFAGRRRQVSRAPTPAIRGGQRPPAIRGERGGGLCHWQILLRQSLTGGSTNASTRAGR